MPVSEIDISSRVNAVIKHLVLIRMQSSRYARWIDTGRSPDAVIPNDTGTITFYHRINIYPTKRSTQRMSR